MAIITKKFKTYAEFQAFSIAFPEYLSSAGLAYDYSPRIFDDGFVKSTLEIADIYISGEFYVSSGSTYYEVGYGVPGKWWKYAIIITVANEDKALLLKLAIS